jgi:hypothetical protein
VHGAGEHRAQDHPEKTRKIAELGCKDRPDQWPRPGNGGKMMTEQHPLAHRNVILTVVQPMGGSFPKIIDG